MFLFLSTQNAYFKLTNQLVYVNQLNKKIIIKFLINKALVLD
jgi:hypothetical protein